MSFVGWLRAHVVLLSSGVVLRPNTLIDEFHVALSSTSLIPHLASGHHLTSALQARTEVERHATTYGTDRDTGTHVEYVAALSIELDG